jgi:hypothetical protein
MWPNFKILSRHSPRGTEENHENRIAGLQARPVFARNIRRNSVLIQPVGKIKSY